MQLFHETFEDALRELVAALGGAKPVAGKLRPAQTPEGAHRWLLDCLNGERTHRLHPDDLRMLLRMGRDAGVHCAANFLLRDVGYHDAVVSSPAAEATALQQQVLSMGKDLSAVLARLESLAGKH